MVHRGVFPGMATQRVSGRRQERLAAESLFCLHTSPIMTPVPVSMGMDPLNLGPASAFSQPAPSRVVRRERRHSVHHDAAGTLCALMATQDYSPPHAVRSRAASLMSLDDGDSGDDLMFDAMDHDGRSMSATPRVGAYSPDSRRRVINRFLEKRRSRIWKKRIKYDVRKNFADSRLRVKGRFVRKEDEEQLRDFLSMTA